MKKNKWIIYVIICLTGLIVQFFLYNNTYWWRNFLIAPSLLMLGIFHETKIPFFVIFIFGLGLGFFSILPWGLYAIILYLTFILAKFILGRFLSKITPYSIILFSFLGLFIYQTIFLFFAKLTYLMGLVKINLFLNKQYLGVVILEILLSVFLVIFLSWIFKLNKKHFYV